MNLNLGCFNSMLEGYVNVDIYPPADVIHDLTVTPWPWGDETVERIVAYDILEHMPSFVAFMNECHRVLVHRGVLDIIVPTPTDNFWLDPTHIRPYMPESFKWFCEEGSPDLYMGVKGWNSVETLLLPRPQCPAVRALLVK